MPSTCMCVWTFSEKDKLCLRFQILVLPLAGEQSWVREHGEVFLWQVGAVLGRERGATSLGTCSHTHLLYSWTTM